MATGTHEYQSDFVRRFVLQGRAEGRAEGEAKGEATAVLSVLDARGIVVPDDARARIMGCSDVEQLDAWVRRAVTADSVNDVFAERHIVIGESASDGFEDLMKGLDCPYQSDFSRFHYLRGMAEGIAMATAKRMTSVLLAVLETGGFDVTDDVRARIVGCTDPGQLVAWVRRAANASSISDVFD